MAVVKITSDNVTLTDAQDVTTFLAVRGIEYERWTPAGDLPADAPADAVLEAYAHQIQALKRRGGYVTADVIDVKPDTPNLDVMLAKFNKEHWHDEDEVRFIIEGRGIFHINAGDSVFALEVGRAISSACPAGRTTGSTSAPRSGSGRFVCSRTRRDGRRTTPRAAWTAGSSRSASVRRTSGLRACRARCPGSRTREGWLRLCA